MSKRKLELGSEESKVKRAKLELDVVHQQQLLKLEQDDNEIAQLQARLRVAELKREQDKKIIKDSFLNVSEIKTRALEKWAQENKLDLADKKKFIIEELNKNIQPRTLLEWMRAVILNEIGTLEQDIWVQMFMRLKLLNRADLQYFLEVSNPSSEYPRVAFKPVFEIKNLPTDSIKKMMILFHLPLHEMKTSNTKQRSGGMFIITHDFVWKGRIESGSAYPSGLRYRPLLISYLTSPSISHMLWDLSSIDRILDWMSDDFYDESTMTVVDSSVVRDSWFLSYREIDNDTKSDWISKEIYDDRKNLSALWSNKSNADDPSFKREKVKELKEMADKVHSQGVLKTIKEQLQRPVEEEKEIGGLDEDEVMSGSDITPTPSVSDDLQDDKPTDMVAIKFQNLKRQYYVMPVILAKQIPEIKTLLQNIQLNSADQKRKAQEYKKITPEVVYDSDEENESKSSSDFTFDFARFGDIKYYLDFSGAGSVFESIKNFPKVWNHFIKFVATWAVVDWTRPHLLLDRHFPPNLEMDFGWSEIDNHMYSSTTFLFAYVSMTEKSVNTWDYETWNGVHILSQFLQVTALTEMIEMYFSIFLSMPFYQLPMF